MPLEYLKKVLDAFCDQQIGIQTGGEFRPRDSSLHLDATKTTSLSYPLISRYVRLLEPKPDDVVYDVGCGTGRALCFFARQKVAKCIGIELDASVADIAKDNVAALKGRQSPVEIVVADAALADYSLGTVFWIYNPFGHNTLSDVLERIHTGMSANPRVVRFCYIQPERNMGPFSTSPWLIKYRTVEPLLYRSGRASFWKSTKLTANPL